MAHHVDEEDLDDSPLRLDRRQHNNIKDWAVIVTLVINLAGFVWTAAKWSSAIDQLQASRIAMDGYKDASTAQINNLVNRVNLLEYQVNFNKAKLEGIK